MNINNLSLQKVVGNDWRYYLDFQYADFSGKAELHKADHIILFRKENDVSVISLQAVGLCDKDLIRTADKILMEVGLDLRMGDSRNKIVKKFGTPDLIDCIEEGYFRYFDYNYEFTDKYLITRYHYLLAPNLLLCFGIPKKQYQKLTDLEIVNDYQMVSAIMEKRIAHKKSGNEIFPCNDRLRFIHQTVTMVFEFGTLFRWNNKLAPPRLCPISFRGPLFLHQHCADAPELWKHQWKSKFNRKAPRNAVCAQRALAKLLGGKERRLRGAETGIAVDTLYLCECRRTQCASGNDKLHTIAL